MNNFYQLKVHYLWINLWPNEKKSKNCRTKQFCYLRENYCTFRESIFVYLKCSDYLILCVFSEQCLTDRRLQTLWAVANGSFCSHKPNCEESVCIYVCEQELLDLQGRGELLPSCSDHQVNQSSQTGLTVKNQPPESVCTDMMLWTFSEMISMLNEFRDFSVSQVILERFDQYSFALAGWWCTISLLGITEINLTAI